MNDAQKCRKNKWKVGTHLAGDEGYGVTVIRITAIGEAYVLARTVRHRGEAFDGGESLWSLEFRDWKKVSSRSKTTRGRT